ncbi:Chromosome partitioning protein parB [Roseomonas mucosa]|uniref:Chromosome-partitioning protein parB n=2 Tax=Roseomonas mucosa TaxID=207340 RepID=A0A379MYQ4_9PROT|nr:Chromosome partitioning protein parB [Roseomonas mucosa]QDD93354.1 Chromosome partitioning protein parB [Roseomonas mucosa]QDD98457.1 Chromosome partitioning protein parB [Roseomonas mucosa]UZO90651.1 Chromosome partitioning protein parB [Roseomonas mucosa]SUE39473.1 Chromosome-partitioning protein parB [Roseomonas mucosa]
MKKPARLGMGLSALLGDAPVAVAATASPSDHQRMLPIEALEPGPFQPRGPMEQEALQELAESIREHGILQPILVRPKPGTSGVWQIIGGERRWRAAQLAKQHEVPVVVRDFDDRTAMAAGLVENLQREDLNPLEEAIGYQRLLDDFGLKQETLGQAVGKSRSHVANTLRLLNLPDKVRALLSSGSLTAGHARALLTADDPVALAEQVVTRGLNVRQTEALAAATPARPNAARTVSDPETKALEKDLGERLGLGVAIRRSGKGGKLVLSWRDLDQLESVLRLLKPGTAPHPGDA